MASPQPPLHAIYTKEVVPVDVDKYSLQQLQAQAKYIEDDLSLLSEESRMFAAYIHHLQKEAASGAARGGDDDGDFDDHGTAEHKPKAGKRTGAGYSKAKDRDQGPQCLSVEDKTTIATADNERLKKEREQSERQMEDAREVFRATLEEAHNRIKELKMEQAFFIREVTTERDISADKVVAYMDERPVHQGAHVRKTDEKIEQIQKQISKLSGQLKARDDVGDSFHEIDFSQLEIENHQFVERIKQKEDELKELKERTTRTVQKLNRLQDDLNTELAKQQAHRKDLKLRQDRVEALKKEIKSVEKEREAAKAKHEALKIQHESVKVPKVEDYIAQKAETYELRKAVQNWERKVDIASGHVAVMKQQMLSLRKKLGLSITGPM